MAPVPVTAMVAPCELVTGEVAVVGTTNVIAVGVASPKGSDVPDELRSFTDRVFPPQPWSLVLVVEAGDARLSPLKVIFST